MKNTDGSFNPCFGGSYIVTDWDNVGKIVTDSRFNPCFGGSYIVTCLENRIAELRVKFQSLFWWILYCDLTTH